MFFFPPGCFSCGRNIRSGMFKSKPQEKHPLQMFDKIAAKEIHTSRWEEQHMVQMINTSVAEVPTYSQVVAYDDEEVDSSSTHVKQVLVQIKDMRDEEEYHLLKQLIKQLIVGELCSSSSIRNKMFIVASILLNAMLIVAAS